MFGSKNKMEKLKEEIELFEYIKRTTFECLAKDKNGNQVIDITKYDKEYEVTCDKNGNFAIERRGHHGYSNTAEKVTTVPGFAENEYNRRDYTAYEETFGYSIPGAIVTLSGDVVPCPGSHDFGTSPEPAVFHSDIDNDF